MAPSGWSVGSGMKDEKWRVPHNLLKMGGNPSSDAGAPEEPKYNVRCVVRLCLTRISTYVKE